MTYTLKRIYFLLLFISLFQLFSSFLFAQNVIIKGIVKDGDTKKPVSFATVNAIGYQVGGFSNLDGEFHIEMPKSCDSISVSYVGYTPVRLRLDKANSTFVQIDLYKKAKSLKEAVVKIQHGVDRAETFMKIVVEHKPQNNPERYNSIGYQTYSKAELLLKNYDPKKLNIGGIQSKMFNAFNALDTANITKKSLPLSFKEKISVTYESQKPKYATDKIIATKSLGLQTDELIRYVDRFDIKYNIYDNWIPIYNKTYVSPIAENGTKYYKYYLGDTLIVNGKRQFQIHFEPRNNEINGFKGLMYINDSTYSVRSILMQIAKNANLNYIKNIRFNEVFSEFKDASGSNIYFPKKNQLDITFESGLELIGIPTKTKQDAVQLNYIITKLYDSLNVNAKQPKNEFNNVQNDDNALRLQKDDSYWQSHRMDTLTIHQQSIYKMIDTLKKDRKFDASNKLIYMLTEGMYQYKYVNVGPYLNTLSYNSLVGISVGMGVQTNSRFNEKWNIDARAKYGFGDKRLKGQLILSYIYPTIKWKKTSVGVRSYYSTNIENLRDNIADDNIINTFLKKPGPIYRTFTNEILAKHEQQIGKFFIANIDTKYSSYTPNFPFSYHPIDDNGQIDYTKNKITLPIAEVNLSLRFSKNQKYHVHNFQLYDDITYKPIYTIGISQALKIADSKFNFQKYYFAIHQALKLPPKSTLHYSFCASNTVGTLPFIVLNVPLGNSFLVSTRGGFNTILPFELVADKLLTYNSTINMGGGILDKFPLLKQLHWRESISLNAFWGTLNEKNRKYNNNTKLLVPDKEPFAEVGVGIENIFHVLSIDYYRRLNYLENVPKSSKGNIFLGIKLIY